jgi:hypothetical protein
MIILNDQITFRFIKLTNVLSHMLLYRWEIQDQKYFHLKIASCYACLSVCFEFKLIVADKSLHHSGSPLLLLAASQQYPRDDVVFKISEARRDVENQVHSITSLRRGCALCRCAPN